MSVWEAYDNQVEARGATRREAILSREKRRLSEKLRNSLSYFSVEIGDYTYMGEQNVSIANSDNLNEKFIFTLPDEDIACGSLVRWMDNYWLVTEKDANVEVYTRCKMVQCNYLLKWVDEDHMIQEQWCIVEDGTKYLTGEYEDRSFVTTRGDSRIAVTLPRDIRTAKLNRKNRFLIDDPEAGQMLAYALTKPLRFGSVYNGHGVFKFVMQEVNSTEDDSFEYGIADYYKHFPKPEKRTTAPDDAEDDAEDTEQKRSWI